MQSTFLRCGAATIGVGAVTAVTLLASTGLASAAPVNIAFQNACYGDAVIKQHLLENTSIDVDAPASVEPGEEFTFRIQQAASAYPNSASGATTTNMSRLKFDFMIPENSTFVKAEVVEGTSRNLGGVAPNVLRVNEGGNVAADGQILRLSGNNQVIGNSPTSSTNSEGGILVPKSKLDLNGNPTGGDTWFRLPAVDVTVIAGDSGVVEPRLRTAGAAGNYGAKENYSSFLPKASLFGTQWAPTTCLPSTAKQAGASGIGAEPLAVINVGTATPVDVDTTTALTGATAVETGATENFTATVAPAGATGSLQLTVNGANAGAAVAVTAGQSDYTLSHTFDSAGSFDVKAVFTADAGFASSSSAGHSVTVTDAAVPDKATTTMVTEPDSAEVGVGVNISAQISPAPAGGTVQFKDGGNNIGAAVEVDASGSATLSQHVFNSDGQHSITAVYSGIAGFEGSTSAPRTVTVSAPVVEDVGTTTTLTAPGAAAIGDTVTLEAKVDPANAGGTVQFKVGGENVGTPVAIGTDGVAKMEHTFTTAGSHDVTAEFTAGAGFKNSSSTVSKVVVSGGDNGGDDGGDGGGNPFASLGQLGALFGSLNR